MSAVNRVHFSAEAVAAAARSVEQHAVAGQAQWRSAPEIATTTCGQGFAEHGAQLQEAAARLCAHGKAMYAGLERHAPAVREQWQVFTDGDDVGATQLSGIEVAS
ncbi:MAG: hypothetical protein Q4E11_05835 [Corynebacterium sp.]|uniref:hypothetical protein n=1 Tax=Corynebacterium sp. TaxID=1720 RepID=UPI0026DA7FF9|nr:hypothetical protein [Corynebacterium sp.]MDO5030088.1 hypothetical protein [Corynebacterium sp.]